MIIAGAPSPNFNERKGGKNPTIIILHYTDMLSGFDSLQRLQDADAEVSAHYLIDEDGSTMQLVDENMRAWHAGASWWEGEEDINSCSIGIEIQNPGHSHGYRKFPPEQIKSVVELCRLIIGRHHILPHHVLAHSDIAPLRKKDPGEWFPWMSLSLQKVGLWPKITVDDEYAGDELLSSEEKIRDVLTRYGYDPGLDFKTVVTAFQRHFQPEIFENEEDVGIPNRATVERLSALMRQKLALRRKV